MLTGHMNKEFFMGYCTPIRARCQENYFLVKTHHSLIYLEEKLEVLCSGSVNNFVLGFSFRASPPCSKPTAGFRVSPAA